MSCNDYDEEGMWQNCPKPGAGAAPRVSFSVVDHEDPDPKNVDPRIRIYIVFGPRVRISHIGRGSGEENAAPDPPTTTKRGKHIIILCLALLFSS